MIIMFLIWISVLNHVSDVTRQVLSIYKLYDISQPPLSGSEASLFIFLYFIFSSSAVHADEWDQAIASECVGVVCVDIVWVCICVLYVGVCVACWHTWLQGFVKLLVDS